jgi:hypothetical protein
MVRRAIVFVSVVVYFAAVGCVVWPDNHVARDSGDDHSQVGPITPGEAVPARTTGMPYRGIAMQVQRIDRLSDYSKSIDQIAGVGADTVEFIIDNYQENGSSTQIYIDQRTSPSADRLAELIAYAKHKGLRVILMPIVLLDHPKGNEWRGTIRPDQWEDWFDSYRDMLTHYTAIAQKSHVDVLAVGSELLSTESHLDEWSQTIQRVRKEYTGQITYSANWDHYQRIPFWDQLDFVGINSYYTLGKNDKVTVPDILKAWAPIQNDLHAFSRRVHKPIVMLEVGWCSMANAASEPWDYTVDEVKAPTDLALQKRLYEGMFQAWYGVPWYGGFMIFEWPAGDNGGPDDRGYTPLNKPAEEVLHAWLAKPGWKVNAD